MSLLFSPLDMFKCCLVTTYGEMALIRGFRHTVHDPTLHIIDLNRVESPMELSTFSIVPLERCHVRQVIELWRQLHPQWIWLKDPSAETEILNPLPNRELIRYVVEHRSRVIATVFTSRALDDSGRNRARIITFETQAADINVDWVRAVFESLASADRERPGMRQVVNAQPNLIPLLRPMLDAEGFLPSFKVLRIEWCGDSVSVAQPYPLRFRHYAGGDRELDEAIVELRNRSFRAERSKPQIDVEGLTRRNATLQQREFVLALEADRLVGYAEWCIDAGEAWIACYAVARSHWGTAIAGILGAKVMDTVLRHGHTKMVAIIRSTNAPVMRHVQALGWTIAAEVSHTFVREF
jgi:Acetyltransferase (GNAT) family